MMIDMLEAGMGAENQVNKDDTRTNVENNA